MRTAPPGVPQQFWERLEGRWPGALTLAYEPFSVDKEIIVVPLLGMSYWRRVTDGGGIECRYIMEPNKQNIQSVVHAAMLANALDWWPVPKETAVTCRWIVRECSTSGKTPKVFDCMTDDHQPVNLGDRIIEALGMREDAFVELEKQIIEYEQGMEISPGEYLNKKQLQARTDDDTDMHDAWMDLADGVAGVKRAYMYDPPPKPGSFVIKDRRKVAPKPGDLR